MYTPAKLEMLSYCTLAGTWAYLHPQLCS